MPKKYGIVSDLHGSFEYSDEFKDYFRSENVDGIIFNGDVVGGKIPDDQLIKTLGSFSDYENDIYVIPGCSEDFYEYTETMGYLESNFDNIHDMSMELKVEQSDHDLIFVPGSIDELGSNGFIYNEKHTGKKIEPDTVKLLFSLERIEKVIDRPESTVVVSHVPKKFRKDDAIDYDRMGVVKMDFIADDNSFRKGNILSKGYAQALKKLGYPVEIESRNFGSELLTDFIERNQINKGVSGHFHEYGARAVDGQGKLLNEDEFYENIFYNPGPASERSCGIITVDGNRMKYEQM